ncbi:MAG: PHP domain-containing protein [Gammaproteobacteria bacterium]
MIDLHLHSRASDGTLTPTELIQLAAARGVQLLALTDHDCVDGLAEARAAAQTAGIRFINGVELSVTWEHKTLHVVGLNIDPANVELTAGLARLRAARKTRALEIDRRLGTRDIHGAYAGANILAGNDNVSRTHFAQWLVEHGNAKTHQDAFRRFLARGKPGHVPVIWASLEEGIGWIHAAGGRAVLAHPLRYDMTRAWLIKALAAFKQAGGDGIEVICGHGNRDECATAAHYATRFGFAASVGSDFHNPSTPWNQPGIEIPIRTKLKFIWKDFSQDN